MRELNSQAAFQPPSGFQPGELADAQTFQTVYTSGVFPNEHLDDLVDRYPTMNTADRKAALAEINDILNAWTPPWHEVTFTETDLYQMRARGEIRTLD